MNLSVTLSTQRQAALELFNDLKLKAFFGALGQRLRGRRAGLENFTALLPKLSPNYSDAGIQNIRLEQITGSVSRAHDFDASFRPLKSNLRERWIANYLHVQAGHLETIRVFQVGAHYFVEDGHHRVSVGRATGMVYIQAEVREYHLKPATPTFSELVSQARRASRAEPAVEAACPCAPMGREA